MHGRTFVAKNECIISNYCAGTRINAISNADGSQNAQNGRRGMVSLIVLAYVDMGIKQYGWTKRHHRVWHVGEGRAVLMERTDI